MGDGTKQREFAGLVVKSDISLGNIIMAASMLVAVVAFGQSLRADINKNTDALSRGILPAAERRLTALETTVNIEIRALRSNVVDLKEEIRSLRIALKRSAIKPDSGDG